MFLLPLLLLFKICFASDEDKIDISHLTVNAFGLPSENTGKLVSNWNESTGDNPEELGEYGEGDILFPPTTARNGLKAQSSRWLNGIIPFEIKGYYNAFDMDIIGKALEVYHNKTCLRFVPRTSEKDYICITNANTGCWSSVGRIGGRQVVNLQSTGCTKKIGTVLHELMHAAGFLHEQNRPERDSYVKIMWKNIKFGHEHNFNKAKKKTINDFGVMYDFRSVMHYSANAFSANKEKTIVSMTTGVEIGQREGFSRGDIQKINKMYNCNNKT